MAIHEAQSYKEPGSFDEQSRRTFLANATLAVGGVISLVLAIPLVTSLIPESLIVPGKNAAGVWANIPKDEFDKVVTNAAPVKITFDFKWTDGYFPPAEDTQFVWGVKLTPQQEENFKKTHPDLYTLAGKVDYPAITMSYVIFSSICPHLGCRFEWSPAGFPNRFACPCHGSQFTREGVKISGPTPRGLDPLPFRDKNGQAQVTWIQYKSGQADRVIVAYS